MRERIRSAMQLGARGLFNRAVWRGGLIFRGVWFRTLRWRLRKPPIREGHEIALAEPKRIFLASRETVMEVLKRQNSIAEGERLRILRIAGDTLQQKVDVRGYGEVRIDLSDKNWYAFHGDVNLMVNRHDFLVSLVQASLLTEDSRYRDCVISLFDYWIKNFNINGLVDHDKPIDAAIRVLNWLWVLNFRVAIEEIDLHKLLTVIYEQIEYIKAYRSAGGNHLVLEALAVYVAGSLLDGTSYGRTWKGWGEKTLIREMKREVFSDGVHTEQSTFYHQVVTTHFLKFYLTANLSGDALPAGFIERLQKMHEYVHQSMKPDLTHPILGDGNLLSTDDREHWESKLLLSARSLLFDLPLYEGFRDALNDSTVWFLGQHREDVETTGSAPASCVYPASGIAVLRDEGYYLCFDAGLFGDREFPHHGHADALGIDVCLDEENLLADAGGYGYVDDTYRRYFRGTRAHNTILVDGRDQSQVFGVFGYGALANVKLTDWAIGHDLDYVEGVHDGYAPIEHVRRIYFRKNPVKYFVVIDLISGDGLHDLEILLHFADKVQYDRAKSVARYPSGTNCSCVTTYSPMDLDETIVKGGTDPSPQGWLSLHTSEKRPAEVLVSQTRSRLPMYCVTILFQEHDGLSCEYLGEKDRIVIVGSREGETFSDTYDIGVERKSVRLSHAEN